MFLCDTSPVRLSEALDRLQTVCGNIGLNISAKKTEWLYLHNPNSDELDFCRTRRNPLAGNENCCEQVRLAGKPLKHVSCFKYLGSSVSENGGMVEDTRSRVQQAEVLLEKYHAIWSSELTQRAKVRHLKSHVFPALLYATECGNHTQDDLKMIDIFLNKCRRRILSVGRRHADGLVIDNAELERQCPLPTPLDLLSRRRLAFAAKTITKPSSITARRMFFAEVYQPGTKKVGGRARSSYLNVLSQDLKYLNSGDSESPFKDLSHLMAKMSDIGPPGITKALKAMKPDVTRGSSVRLVNQRLKTVSCNVAGCQAAFAEKKELNRHIRRCHSNEDKGGSAPVGVGEFPFNCNSCSRSFRTVGWLNRHITANHGLAAPYVPSVPPLVPRTRVGSPISNVSRPSQGSAMAIEGGNPPTLFNPPNPLCSLQGWRDRSEGTHHTKRGSGRRGGRN